MDQSQKLRQALDRMLAAGPVEIHEGGAWLAALQGFRYELREEMRPGEDGIVLLHLWSGECNLVRRVLAIEKNTSDHLTVEIMRLGRERPDRLEFIASNSRRAPARVTREQFSARFRELLARHFPDETVGEFTTAPDLKRSLSGSYARGLVQDDSNAWAVLAAGPSENSATYNGILTFGLLWLDRARESARRKQIAGLRLFFPRGEGRITAHRLQALAPSTVVDLYEYDTQNWRARRMELRDLGNVESWLTPRREIEATLSQAAPEIDRIRRMAPDAIEADVIPGTNEVALRFRGLLFARWRAGAVFYGTGSVMRPLTPAREPDFAKLIRDLDKNRSALAPSKHPAYRAQPERWLQSLIALDPTKVDAMLDPRFLYAQVPAATNGDRGILDLLGVTRSGRLAIVELKASEDVQLILQAVDYWLRVRWHLDRQEFQSYGYFPGVTLDPRPPLLFLVAPSLQFHPAQDALLRHLSDEIEVLRVGISENWRRGIRVVLRQSSRLAI